MKCTYIECFHSWCRVIRVEIHSAQDIAIWQRPHCSRPVEMTAMGDTGRRRFETIVLCDYLELNEVPASLESVFLLLVVFDVGVLLSLLEINILGRITICNGFYIGFVSIRISNIITYNSCYNVREDPGSILLQDIGILTEFFLSQKKSRILSWSKSRHFLPMLLVTVIPLPKAKITHALVTSSGISKWDSACPRTVGKDDNILLKFYSKINRKGRCFDSFEV
jgi:hypothetical protein